jgi:hypothetical protein
MLYGSLWQSCRGDFEHQQIALAAVDANNRHTWLSNYVVQNQTQTSHAIEIFTATPRAFHRFPPAFRCDETSTRPGGAS